MKNYWLDRRLKPKVIDMHQYCIETRLMSRKEYYRTLLERREDEDGEEAEPDEC